MQRQNSVKFDARTVQREDIPGWENLPDNRAERKLQQVRTGAELMHDMEAIPNARPCQDMIWAILFVLMVLAVTACAGIFGVQAVHVLDDRNNARLAVGSSDSSNVTLFNDPGGKSGSQIISAVIAGTIVGCLVSLLVTMAFVWCSHHNAKLVVYASLYFGPLLTIMMGIGMVAFAMQNGGNLMFLCIGGVMILFGGLGIVCVMCCYAHLIPFMIKLLTIVSEVILQNPCMLLVAFVGSIFSIIWTLLSSVAFGGMSISLGLAQGGHDDGKMNGVEYAFLFVACVCLFWGSFTVYYVSHTIYSGVFGRWYYQRDEERPLAGAIAAGLGPAFGSCALGGLIIALVRALEQVMKQAQRESQREGNMVMCVIFCLISCCIDCIGDMIEYFNEWAYVQVALRGVRFFDAVRITFSLLTVGNLQYIISDLLLNSVVTLGSFASGALASAAGFLVGWSMGGLETGAACAIICFICGIVIGSISLAIISSGVKTILVCWVDSPERLAQDEKYGQIETELVSRINGGYDTQRPGQRQRLLAPGRYAD